MREYKILGLNENASLDEIKTAYRKLAKKFHPDINPHGQKVFVEITNAYDHLLKNYKVKPDIKVEAKKETKAPEPPPQPQNWTPDLRYQFFDPKKKRWVSNRYRAQNYMSKSPDYDKDGFIILRMPKECFDYNGMIEFGGKRFFFTKDQPDGSIAEIGNVRFKIVKSDIPMY